jgi:hypothetical protein
MLSSTVKYISLGTKRISLVTRFKQPRNFTSFCCVSHAIVKLVPVDQLNCNYSAKGTFIDVISLLQLPSLHTVSVIGNNTFLSLQMLQQYINNGRSVNMLNIQNHL